TGRARSRAHGGARAGAPSPLQLRRHGRARTAVRRGRRRGAARAAPPPPRARVARTPPPGGLRGETALLYGTRGSRRSAWAGGATMSYANLAEMFFKRAQEL